MTKLGALQFFGSDLCVLPSCLLQILLFEIQLKYLEAIPNGPDFAFEILNSGNYLLQSCGSKYDVC